MSSVRLVDSEPGQSRYAALAAAMRARIVGGEWPPGSAIPAEQTLAAEHGVALGTMRRALELLAEQGLVERVHGRGTFVRQGLSGAPMLRFFRFGAARGEAPRSRILARDTLAAPAEVARALGSGPGEPALRLRRLRSLGGQPVLHEEIWLPLPLFAPLAEGDAAAWGDLLYPLFAERCGVHVHRAVDSIGFGSLGAAQARSLRLPAGHPCARVQRQAFDLAGRCVEWRASLGDANAFHYTVAIT
ncbi:GntR family transcriptional regulator [Aquabacterium sp. OR-4]|uniref:GntR family transcriptional regulator n=1 Tax=Aquabacterium sp. OR-4 TaxID=2978127 RepID=UPI0028C5EF57|nr:GntR family transcriptional regulator [Aquabacterium sp. OR-4]MDT7838657.1 GntR family transcriptional regulator [Aquabacterium sp. OR-4]